MKQVLYEHLWQEGGAMYVHCMNTSYIANGIRIISSLDKCIKLTF